MFSWDYALQNWGRKVKKEIIISTNPIYDDF